MKNHFAKYVRVQFYTDTVPEEFYKDARRAIANCTRTPIANSKKTFRLSNCPIRDREAGRRGRFETVAMYDEGRKSHNVPAFVEFLKKPLGEN